MLFFFFFFFSPFLTFPFAFQHDAQLDFFGRRLATCSSDRTIKIFDVAGDANSLVAELKGHEVRSIELFVRFFLVVVDAAFFFFFFFFFRVLFGKCSGVIPSIRVLLPLVVSTGP